MRRMQKLGAAAGVTLLLCTGVAVAATGPTVNVSVTPDTPSSHSTLKLTAKGPLSESGLPTSLKLIAQKGFESSAKSVAVLCNPKSKAVTSNSSDPCPAKSKIGSGEVIATVQPFGKQTVPFTMYLGKPQKRGDIASIVISAQVPSSGTQNVVGRLFKGTNGGIEVLFAHLPKAPKGFTITFDKLTFSAHAVRGKQSLITNPPTCSGHWHGSFTLVFANHTYSTPTSIACTK